MAEIAAGWQIGKPGPMPETEDLRTRAERWMKDDPDPATQAELGQLLAASDLDKTDLADRFAGALEFGTAGLRGVLGAGPNRMNRAVVLRTTHGLGKYLLAALPDAAKKGVVIGYDGRRYSREFAEDTALALAALGIHAHLFTVTVPTPLTAFAVKDLGAAAGVMVTASHNPPEYNGYKVYWANSAQIIPPVDAAIASSIEKAPAAREVPRMGLEEARGKKLVSDVAAATFQRYLDDVSALTVNPGGDRSLRIVYTPMHGVGDDLARKVLARAGFANVTSVPEQQKPDGAFPTVAFPNPEEKGAMDLSFALGKKLSADLILANDPDADRLAVALPSLAAAAPSGFVQLTGNQVGILMGHYLLTESRKGAAIPVAVPVPPPARRLVLASIVSSPMLGAIARALSVRYEETLTGFKWIANRAMDLEKEGYSFVFGYEEALGYTVGDVVRDKDGISAAMIIAEMAAVAKARGKTLLTELDDIYRRYGLFVSSQVSVTKKGAEGISEIGKLMDRLRAAAPERIGAHKVEAISDFRAGTRAARGATSGLTLPKTNMLAFDLEGNSRIIARPSGTEPKVKFYFDVREAVKDGERMEDARGRAERTMKDLSEAFVKMAG